jgi:hypothetical protein
MSTPTRDNAFLYELELNVKTELTLAETSQPEADADGAPTIESLLEQDDQRYELGLRSLLGAIEAVEDVFRPGDDPQAAVRDCYAPTRSAT